MFLREVSRKALILQRNQAHGFLFNRGFASSIKEVEEKLTKLTMPALSPTMETGTITKWLKQEGETVAPGDILCQVETDKAVVDYEMQDDAVLAMILQKENAEALPVGALLGYTMDDADEWKKLKDDGSLEAFRKSVAEGGNDAVEETSSETSASESPKEEKSAAAPASDGGIPPRVPMIKFLGKRSLLKEDPHAKKESKPAAEKKAAPAADSEASTAPVNEDYEDIPLTNMRKVIAKRLSASKNTVPHNYASIDCEIDDLMKFRKTLKNVHGVKVSINDIILKSVALALRDVPEANHYFDTKKNMVQKNDSVDVSVAVATDSGLITPIVPNVDSNGLGAVNSKFKELVAKARENRLKPEEFQGGSFTVSNLGGFGMDKFVAVINPPQACILAIGKGRKTVMPPRNLEDPAAEPRLATLLNVTLSSDRRVVDDVIAGQFLQSFKKYMENPELMVL